MFDPSRYTDEELLFNPEKEIIPIAIHCVAYEGPEGDLQIMNLDECIVLLH